MKARDHLHQYTSVLTGCGVVTLLTVQRQAGCLWFMLGPILLLWFCYGFVLSLWKPERRRPLLVQASLWLLSALLAFFVQRHYFVVARQQANQLVSLVEQYRQLHGQYPAGPEAIGIARQPQHDLRQPFYVYGKNGPAIFYAATFIPFDTYDYDFTRREWAYRSD